MRSAVGELLAALAAGFEALGVAWYLFGARAAILYGVARLTADVDVTARLPATVSNDDLVHGLERYGFQPRVASPAFVARTRVLPFVHSATGLPVDVVVAGPGLEEQFLGRATIHEIEGVRVSVASAEDVVVMKVLAARPKDVGDASAIVSTHRALDVAYIRATLATLEDALGQSDLLPVLDRLVAGRLRR